MNEDFNPYDKQRTREPQYGQTDEDYSQPRQSYEDYSQPRQPYEDYSQPCQSYEDYSQPRQPYEDYSQPQYPVSREQYYRDDGGYYPYTDQTYRRRGGGMVSKIFAIISFVTGCISLMRVISFVLSTMVNTGLISNKLLFLDSDSLIVSAVSVTVPGLVFGIIALVKKTRLLPMAVLGVVFNGMLILSAFAAFFLYLSFGISY